MITRRVLLTALPAYTRETSGAVNRITAAKRKQAAALVREGVSVSLSRGTAADAAAPRTLAVNAFTNGILSRGILFDIPVLKGVLYLESGALICPKDLDAWEKKTGLKVAAGDVVFIRAGRWAHRSAGLHASCAAWLRMRNAAMAGSDAASDGAMGIPVFDNCDLEAISDAAAARKRWEFMISAAPISMKDGAGSPLHPIATF